ncbi:MAG: AmmeMemoRadiSam system protein B, partial [Calditrichaeota bacterium]|nr:AmmeMemoRadiSam system protein B [Calditrichota bacterium]
MKNKVKTLSLIFTLGVITLFFLSNCFSGESKNKVRKPAVAGAFYPADPTELKTMIKDYLQKAEIPVIKDPIVGIIVPHAGYVYSGGVAAHAYKALQNRDIERVIVISPSHIDYFNGASVYDGTAYRTPLGDIPVDREFAKKLADRSDRIELSERGHSLNFQGRGEHALEVQLPFLQVVLGKFKLVPIVMGEQSYETSRALGRALADLIKDRKTLIVASSDLSHYHPYNEAIRLDKKVLNAIKEWDYYNLSRNFQGRIWEACGGGPIVSLMIAAEYSGA